MNVSKYITLNAHDSVVCCLAAGLGLRLRSYLAFRNTTFVMPRSHLCGSSRGSTNVQRTVTIPRRLRRSHIDRYQNANLPRPSSTHPQPGLPPTKIFIEPPLETHKWESQGIFYPSHGRVFTP